MLWATEQPLKVGDARSHQPTESSGRRAWLGERDTLAVDLFDAVRPTTGVGLEWAVRVQNDAL